MATTSFAAAFSDIAGVERVYLRHEGDCLEVVTVVARDDDDSIYRKVYSREKEIIHRFPGFQFDFRVIARRGRTFEEVVGLVRPFWASPY